MSNPKKMPVLFIGHGSPMNAIESNDFTLSLQKLAQKIERPKAILMVSAHWMTEGTWVTGMNQPKTIHDFYGFPKELFAVQYPAPGSPELASRIRHDIQNPTIHNDDKEWGYDHGTWSVLRHMYPDATIPLVQLSLDIRKPGEHHLMIGEQLKSLREQGVLIMGSGNIVHNLRRIVWEDTNQGFDWAVEFDAWSKEKLLNRDHEALARDYLKTEAGRLSVPTPDHYLPLLYTAAASDEKDEVTFEYEGFQNGSISMRAVAYGL